jgi:hypothetical protein
VLRALTCQTAKPNTQVTYEVYLLDGNATSPTDGTLVLTKEATYEYGGYHRLMLTDDEDQVAMRKGQRYSVVVTQKCGDKYYQIATRNDNAGIKHYGQWVAKLNDNESWTLASGVWSDWKAVSETVTKDTSYVVDNFPIKGLATQKSWASVDELSALEAAIAKAKDALASAYISADGSDVPEGEAWMTQECYDELASAVAAAEEQLALAGSDYKTTLANTTPDSATVSTATASLAFTTQTGTATAPAPAAGPSSASISTAKASTSPTTGDGALPFAALLAASAAVAAAAVVASVIAARRRVRKG